MNETNCIEAATWKLSGVITIVIFFLIKKKYYHILHFTNLCGVLAVIHYPDLPFAKYPKGYWIQKCYKYTVYLNESSTSKVISLFSA